MVVARNNGMMTSVSMIVKAFGGSCRIVIMQSDFTGNSVVYTWLNKQNRVKQSIQAINQNDGVLVFSGGGEPITFTKDSIRIPSQYKRYITEVHNGTVVM